MLITKEYSSPRNIQLGSRDCCSLRLLSVVQTINIFSDYSKALDWQDWTVNKVKWPSKRTCEGLWTQKEYWEWKQVFTFHLNPRHTSTPSTHSHPLTPFTPSPHHTLHPSPTHLGVPQREEYLSEENERAGGEFVKIATVGRHQRLAEMTSGRRVTSCQCVGGWSSLHVLVYSPVSGALMLL